MRALRSFSRCLLLATLAASWSSAATFSNQEPVILSQPPVLHRADVESGVVLFENSHLFWAEDSETGEKRWSHPLPRKDNRVQVDTGLHHSVLYSVSGQLSVVDHKTGKETARINVSVGGKYLLQAWLDMNDQWVGLDFVDTLVICRLATRQQFKVPLGKGKPIGIKWMPDGKTFFFTEVLSGDAKPTRAQVWFWEPGVSDPVTGGVLECPEYMFVRAVMPGGDLLIHEYEPQKPDNGRIKIVNSENGTVVKTLKLPNPLNRWSGSTQDGTKWYDLDEATNTLSVQDTASGEPLFSLKLPGNKTVRIKMQPSDAGKESVLTWEDNNAAWLVPLEKDGIPRKLLDNSRYLPGNVIKIVPPNMVTSLGNEHPSNSQTFGLFSIDGLEKFRVWSSPQLRGGYFNTIVSDDTKILLLGKTSKTVLVAEEEEAPLLKIEGQPFALSPDGRHVFIRKEHDQAVLVSVDTGQAVMAFTSERGAYINSAAFSPDRRRAAVFHYPELTVVELVEGFPRKNMPFPVSERTPQIYGDNSLTFSPDGTLLLGADYGHAWLFNAVTGEHLHTFVEESRFAAPHHYRQGGFLKRLEGIAEDYAGMVTDRFKNLPGLSCAFTMDGFRAVIIAENQQARVWDVRTGMETGVIRTGLPETRNDSGTIANHCEMSANGTYLFAYNADGYGTASLWETASCRKIKEYRISERVALAAIAEDGRAVYVKIGEDLHILPGRTN